MLPRLLHADGILTMSMTITFKSKRLIIMIMKMCMRVCVTSTECDMSSKIDLLFSTIFMKYTDELTQSD